MFSTSTLAAGTHNVLATFSSGSGNFGGGASAFLAEVVQQFDFALSASSTALTIPSGGYQILTVTLTPIGGFNHAVQLSCGGLPLYAQCVFDPAGAVSLAAGPQQVQLMVNTDQIFEYGKEVGSQQPAQFVANQRPALLAVLTLPLALWRLRRKRHLVTRLSLGLIILLAGALWSAVGCSGKQPGSTPPGAYTITIFGIDTNQATQQSHTITVKLQVKGS